MENVADQLHQKDVRVALDECHDIATTRIAAARAQEPIADAVVALICGRVLHPIAFCR